MAIKRLDFLSEQLIGWLNDAFFVFYLFTGFFFVGRVISGFLHWYGDEMAIKTETNLDEQMMPFFRRMTMVILWIIAVITALSHFDVDKIKTLKRID